MAIGIGSGIYSAREVSRLTGASVHQVDGWIHGYLRTDKSRRPLIRRDAEDGRTLSFLDLIEVIFVSGFLKQGLKMSYIRAASKEAAELFGTHHPFAVNRFETDGKRSFARLDAKKSRKKHMVEVVEGQSVFERVVTPFLIKQIDYATSGSAGDALRWWPLGKRKPVLLDPKIAFGAPITATAHVPTSVLAGALTAGESQESIARWFEVPLKEVKAAVTLEQHMAA